MSRLFSLWAFVLVIAAVTVHAQTPEEFFDDSRIREIRITFEDEDWFHQLHSSKWKDEGKPYFTARVESGGETLERIGVRFKGNASFWRNDAKKPFKLDFNRYDEKATFFGLKKLNLHNFDLSPDFMREKLFHDLSARYVEAPRTVYVRLIVNGAPYGLYLAVEQVDKTMMRDRYGSREDGNLYEADVDYSRGNRYPALAYLGPDQAPYEGLYQLQTNETRNDYSGLIEFIEILDTSPPEELRERLEQVADVRNWLHGLALNNLMVNLESYVGVGSEYFAYQRDRDGRFVHIAKDANESFGTTGDGTPRLAEPMKMPPFWLPFDVGWSGPWAERPLFERLMETPEYRRLYLRMLARYLREGFNPEEVGRRVDELAGLIRDEVYADPLKPYSNADFETALESRIVSPWHTILGIKEFVEGRYNYLRPWLDEKAEAADVRLNELRVINPGPDEFDAGGRLEPWLEILNQGPGPWDVGTLSLTDDPAVPDKWRMPGRVLADGEFQLIWLDGQPEEGPWHANFRPRVAGGRLYLYAHSDEGPVLVDEVEYPALPEGNVYIRLGDMDRNWAVSNRPTPGGENREMEVGPELFINEFMADNDGAVESPDAPGTYEDWVEIYNAGREDVELGGMYLTDNLARPTKWRIPDGVVIPAGGFLVFWADDREELGPLHAGFKLSKSGEELGLFLADGVTPVDTYRFGPQETNVSMGRSPDGSENWVKLERPTPGGPNSGPGI